MQAKWDKVATAVRAMEKVATGATETMPKNKFIQPKAHLSKMQAIKDNLHPCTRDKGANLNCQ